MIVERSPRSYVGTVLRVGLAGLSLRRGVPCGVTSPVRDGEFHVGLEREPASERGTVDCRVGSGLIRDGVATDGDAVPRLL